MQEFKHSVKVPRNYKLASTILKKALTEGASVKSLVFEDKLKHFRTNVLYALISEAIKHNADIDKMFESTQLLQNEPRLDPWLAKILTTELLFGKKDLPGKSKPELTVASYKQKFEEYSTDNPQQITKKGVRRPRYIRINTNLLTTSDAIREFQDEEYRFIRCTSGPYADYLEQVKGLGEYDFMQDYHVKTVFVFPPGTKLHDHPLCLESKIVLQDKATALAVHLLAPPPGSVVMDLCAAPGMKTTQLAAYMKNQGTIYAVERSEDRYKVLCDFVEKTGSTCVQTLHKDSLDIKKGDYPDVEYVLLDPSCSGSGMDLCGHSYIEDARLARLTSLQEKFLKHAMHAFPNVKKIVYSTCSLFPQENERVVSNVVSQCRIKWNVLNVKELLKDQWNNFGTGMYGSMGARCLYARPDSDLTTGFFLAVLEKDPKYSRVAGETVDNEGSDKNVTGEVKDKKKKKTRENDNTVCNEEELSNNQQDVDENVGILENAHNKKKKSKKVKEDESQISDANEIDLNHTTAFFKNEKVRNSKRSKVAGILDANDSFKAETTDHVEGDLINMSLSDMRKKKKKSKELKCEIFDNTTEIKIDDEGSKKKKKKNKQKNELDSQHEILPEETEDVCERSDKPKKKKCIELETEDVPKKKKKKDRI